MKKIAIGTDIGGSHITCGLFDLEVNQMLDEQKVRLRVDSRSSKENILNSWTEAIKKALGTRKIETFAGIGFAMPGPFDYKKGVAWFKGVQKFEDLYGIDVRAELKERLQLHDDFPVRFLNDATCFAIGEAWIGKTSKCERIIALTVGTGLGSAFIKNGFPMAGVEGIPDDGFLYHIPFKNSVADDYFSTRWFLSEYIKENDKQISGVKELSELAIRDKSAQAMFQRFGENLGTFLVPWVKKFNADGIVLGGNISKSYPLFQKELEDSFYKNGLTTTISLSSLDEKAALFGSARLCDDDFYKQLFIQKN
jgi:glucokinase